MTLRRRISTALAVHWSLLPCRALHRVSLGKIIHLPRPATCSTVACYVKDFGFQCLWPPHPMLRPAAGSLLAWLAGLLLPSFRSLIGRSPPRSRSARGFFGHPWPSLHIPSLLGYDRTSTGWLIIVPDTPPHYPAMPASAGDDDFLQCYLSKG